MLSKENRRKQEQKSAIYHELFSGPNGQYVLDDLEKTFSVSVKKGENGQVDPNACLISMGQDSVIRHIKHMRSRYVLD